MTAAKSKILKEHSKSAAVSTPHTRSQELAAQELPPVLNGRKNKKKKGKGKEPAVPTLHPAFADPSSYDDDEIPSLEEADSPTSPRTGFSPVLESVHVSATTIARSGNGITTQVQTGLLAADLHGNHAEIPSNGYAGGKRPHTMPHVPLPKTTGPTGPGMVDEEYWSSFPPHIKTFAQTMYNIAQQMVQSDSYMKATGAATMATEGLPGFSPDAHPPLPFDPSIFSDPAFTLSVEQAAVLALSAAPLPAGQSPRGPHPQSNVVLLNEFGDGEHRVAEDDYYSEDDIEGKYEGEGDLDGFEFHASGMVPHPPNMPDAVAQVVLSYGEHVTRGRAAAQSTLVASSDDSVEPVVTATSVLDDSSAGRKGKKKKGNKDGTDAPAGVPTAPVPNTVEARSAPPAPGLSPEKPTAGLESPQSLTANNAMPATRKENLPANPPPSSRAQGKQPMAYAPSTAATTATAPPNGQQTRTARAASKAPMSAHNYNNHSHHHPSPPSSNASATNKSRSNTASGSNKNSQNNKIWSTSSTEERERIKEFWLGLGEDERRNLVKIEKDTVLKKMKEQQKHSCSCAVCGRKRHAIEEELEVLYDAYYEELERYANHQQRYVSSGGTIPPPPGPGPFPGSVELDKNGVVIGHPQTKSPRNPPRTNNRATPLTNGRKPPKAESEFEDDEGDEEEFEEEDGYDEEDDEEEEEDDEGVEDEDDIKPRDRRNAGTRGRRPVNGTKSNGRDGLFNLGSSLTVTGPNNILTVADDLLKNDGQKFLEMMEQLAERRMQREEEAAADLEDDSDEEDEDDDEEDEDEDEDDDEDDEEVMTEEQKMEEGKRMFSMFAARMFEQRVLQAYREKVAQERQHQLLLELEAEDQLTKEREAKKQSQNQKKKDKRKQQKLAKEEERAAKAAEKAAEEAALKAKQLVQEEEQRRKREEERARREAVRKAAEEERQRKEEERRKRIAEEREREAERERRRKEKEEKAKREREEKERKAREEREAKAAAERAAREATKKEQQEREEREKKLAKEREEKAEKERAAQQQRAAAKNSRQPTSPRPSSSAQRSQSTNGAAKKILTKPTPSPSSVPTPAPVSTTPNNVRTQPQRPLPTLSQPNMPVVQTTPNPFPSPSTPLYPPGTSMVTQAVNTPRLPYAPPPFGVFGPGPSMQPASLAPSALSRSFGSPSPFDPSFSRPLTSAPLATSSKAIQNPLSSPTLLAPGSSRRTSIPEPGPGPVARPLSISPLTPGPISPLGPIAPPAPIARPTGEASGSSSGSPIRRTPSPKVLGSSALAADDDEVVPPPARRVPPGAVGQSWGNSTSPRTIMGEPRGPWGNPTSAAFPTRPPIGGSLWGGMNANSEWPQAPATSFFNSFVNNHTNSSHSPHSGN